MAHARSGNNSDVNEALRHAAAELGRDLSRTAHDAREAAKDITDALNHTLGHAAAEQTREVSHALGSSIRRHPVVWLSAAVGVGCLAALMATRRAGGHA